MATRTLVIPTSHYPVGTVVKAFSAFANRIHGGKPSGTAIAEATVDAAGKLTFAGLAEGLYRLWAEVAGENVNTAAGNQTYAAPAPTLRERIAATRKANGVIP